MYSSKVIQKAIELYDEKNKYFWINEEQFLECLKKAQETQGDWDLDADDIDR